MQEVDQGTSWNYSRCQTDRFSCICCKKKSMFALPHGAVVVVVALHYGLSKASTTSWKCFQEIYKAAAAPPVVVSLC